VMACQNCIIQAEPEHHHQSFFPMHSTSHTTAPHQQSQGYHNAHDSTECTWHAICAASSACTNAAPVRTFILSLATEHQDHSNSCDHEATCTSLWAEWTSRNQHSHTPPFQPAQSHHTHTNTLQCSKVHIHYVRSQIRQHPCAHSVATPAH
jgi:hypothetical protein